jgi:hypothetical protein
MRDSSVAHFALRASAGKNALSDRPDVLRESDILTCSDKIDFITDFGIKNEPHTHRKPHQAFQHP